MKTIHLSLSVPDELDAEEIVTTMAADFFDMNRDDLNERYPQFDDVMDHIELRITDRGVYKVVEL